MHSPFDYGAAWALPFVGMLLSIALLPLAAPRAWHGHQGKISLGWALAFLLPNAWAVGLHPTLQLTVHALAHEYIPFILLLTALYVVGGGISLRGDLRGSARHNTALLGAGALLAGIMGTTGAAMVMVRPVIRANDSRRYRAHVLVFFIFIVANVGGALTPLGDPPLFLGFLRGVDFFWTVRHMFAPTLLLSVLLLGIFYGLDRWFWRQEEPHAAVDPTPDSPLRLSGKWNLLWLAGIVGAVLLSGLWKAQGGLSVLGETLTWPNLARDGLLLGLIAASLLSTPAQVHRENHFTWEPMLEVARLFLGIFLSIIPVVAMLRAGEHGPLAPLVRMASDAGGQPVAQVYFWLAGGLSSVLDNAPTYLVFFNLAGGDAQHLMQQARVLGALSAGAVFMGAMTYIGNAPNLMVKAIAEQRRVPMPSFFAYIAWSIAVLLPCLWLVQMVFWR